jgi:hypothetical protein
LICSSRRTPLETALPAPSTASTIHCHSQHHSVQAGCCMVTQEQSRAGTASEAPPLLLLPAVMSSYSHAVLHLCCAAVSAPECTYFWAEETSAADEGDPQQSGAGVQVVQAREKKPSTTHNHTRCTPSALDLPAFLPVPVSFSYNRSSLPLPTAVLPPNPNPALPPVPHLQPQEALCHTVLPR